MYIITGCCDCGTELKIKITRDPKRVVLDCLFKIKKGKCGKRELREPYRTNVAKTLIHKSVARFRVESADKLMNRDDPEPPILPKSTVLHVAKNRYLESLYLDKDPVVAISKLKRVGETENKYAIRNIGYDPFIVLYWTNYQKLIYSKYAGKEEASLKIDASGKIVSKIRKADQTYGPHVFLYLAVINFSAGQFPVTQMMSEAQDTGTIQHWLTQWIRSGVPPPKETVCDRSRALMTAIIRTFTGHLTIEDYCDVFSTEKLPQTFVRIDVAHFLKIYANLLKNVHRLVKKFYMGVIGAIVMTRNLAEARHLIKSALIVSKSETEGENTPCTVSKRFLLEVITGQKSVDDIVEGVEQNLDVEDAEDLECGNERQVEDEKILDNSWKIWAGIISKEVDTAIITEGDSVNAHYCPVFAKHLLADCTSLPMWSCVFRDKFGFGRIPASSAPVEGEFNKLKNVFFKNELSNIRVDRFIEKHINLLNGSSKLIEAQMSEIEELGRKEVEVENENMELETGKEQESSQVPSDNEEFYNNVSCHSLSLAASLEDVTTAEENKNKLVHVLYMRFKY